MGWLDAGSRTQIDRFSQSLRHGTQHYGQLKLDSGQALTQSQPLIKLTQTWNNAAVAFDAPLFINVTNTASASGSLLADFQLGGQSIFSVGTSGINIFSDNGNDPSIAINGNAIITYFGNQLLLNGQGNTGIEVSIDSGSLTLCNSKSFGWGSGNAYAASGFPDTALWRDGSVATLALGDKSTSTTASAFRVYNTTDTVGAAPTNYERGVFDWTTTANVLTIGTQKGGTGSTRNLQIVIGGTRQLDYGITNSGIFTYNSNILVGSNTLYLGQVATSLNWIAAGIVGIGSSTNGWLNWAGEQRTTAATTYTSNTTLSTILTANVQAGQTYSFECYIPVTASLSTGGIKVALAGTATVTNMIADGSIRSNNAIVGQTQVTSLTTVVSAVGGAATGYVEIHGTITVNAAGTFLIQAAQNTSSATSTVVGRGARLIMHDMP